VTGLRIGVLGAARIADAAIIDPARTTGARVIAVAARNRDRAEAFAVRHGIERVLDSYADVVTDPEVEAIYNPLANGLHGPWNLAAIAAGKHVLSEKPFASNGEEAADVRDAARQAGVQVVEAFHYAYHPLLRRLHDVIASDELGELRSVTTMMAIPAPKQDDPRWSLPLAGGALMDLGCYGLHAMRQLAPYAGGEPTVTGARGGERAGVPDVDEWIDAELIYPSGATALARCNMNATAAEMSMHVVGANGEAVLGSFAVPHRDPRLVVRAGGDERTEDFSDRTSYAYQLEAFTALVRDGVSVPTDGDDAVRNMKLIDACYRAAGFEPRPRSPRID
jgi:predicted dehydrogenase